MSMVDGAKMAALRQEFQASLQEAKKEMLTEHECAMQESHYRMQAEIDKELTAWKQALAEELRKRTEATLREQEQQRERAIGEGLERLRGQLRTEMAKIPAEMRKSHFRMQAEIDKELTAWKQALAEELRKRADATLREQEQQRERATGEAFERLQGQFRELRAEMQQSTDATLSEQEQRREHATGEAFERMREELRKEMRQRNPHPAEKRVAAETSSPSPQPSPNAALEERLCNLEGLLNGGEAPPDDSHGKMLRGDAGPQGLRRQVAHLQRDVDGVLEALSGVQSQANTVLEV
jgi:hypothetical protein